MTFIGFGVKIILFFRLKEQSNEVNEVLNKKINDRGKIHITPCNVNGQFILRFAVCSRFTESEDIQFAFDEICNVTDEILK